jgi:hypothetical protein
VSVPAREKVRSLAQGDAFSHWAFAPYEITSAAESVGCATFVEIAAPHTAQVDID